MIYLNAMHSMYWGLKALRQDPALGAGVIVTTLTDAVAFVAFLGTATLLLDRL